MKKFRIGAITACCVALAATYAAYANDSSAVLAAGGLILTKSADVRMAAEDLYISRDEVRVRYEFVNETDKDIETVVAFPLPLIPPRYPHADGWLTENVPYALGSEGPLRYVAFGASENGYPIAVRMHTRAVFKGRDVSEVLRAAGIPVQTGAYDLRGLSREHEAKLARMGLLDIVAEPEPRWSIEHSFYWTQRFPAGKPVVIEHHYRPALGGGSLSVNDLQANAPERRRYCMDSTTVTPLISENPENGSIMGVGYLSYILTTANNWKGPIGRFHLVIDKPNVNDLVSLCWPDSELRKTSPTRFETEITNFRPTRELEIVFFDRTS